MASKGVVVVISGEDRSGAVLDAVKTHLAEVRQQAEVTSRATVESGEEMSESFLSTRASIGLLDNTIRGAHAQAMADLVRLFAKSRIVMAALPVAATAGGLLLLGGIIFELAKKIHEWHEEQQKLADDFTKFGTSINDVFNGLDRQILEAEKRTDDLRGNHLAALRDELKLIDMQTMSDLVRSLDSVAKAADIVFGDLQSHWYTIGIGAAGAKHALDEFQTQYASLLSQGKDKDASDLLSGTLAHAQKVLELQKDAKANSGGLLSAPGPNADIMEGLYAQSQLQKDGVGYTEKEIKAQEALVQALQAQVSVEQRIHELGKMDKGNATTETNKTIASEVAEAQKKQEEFVSKMRAHQIEAYKKYYEGDPSQIAEMNRAGEEMGKSLDEQINKKSEAAGKDLKGQLDVLRAEQEERIKAANEQMQLAQRTADFEMKMGRMTEEQRVAYLKAALDQELAIKADAEQKLAGIDRAMPNYDPGRVQSDLDAIKEAQQQHDTQMQELAMQDAERRKAIADGLLHSILDPLINKPKSVSDAFKKMADNVLSDLQRIAEKQIIDEATSGFGGHGASGVKGGKSGVSGLAGLGGIFSKILGGGRGKASNGGFASGAGTIVDAGVAAVQQGKGQPGGAGGVVVNVINQGTPQQATSSGSSGGNGLEQQVITIVLKDADTLGPMSSALGGALKMLGSS